MLFNRAPFPPSNPHPPDDSTSVKLSTRLDWKCSDPDGDPLVYDLYFGTQSDLPVLAKGLKESEFASLNLDYGTKYFWRIVARDRFGNTSVSPLWSFTTVSNSPPTLLSFYPRNGSSDIPLDIVLTWKASDPENDLVLTDLYFGDSEKGVEMVLHESTSNQFNLSNLEFSKEYLWKIVLKDEYGNETTSGTLRFFTLRNSPPSVEILNPKSGEIGVKLDPTLVWKARDPEEDELLYDLYFGSNPSPPLYMEDLTSTDYRVQGLEYKTVYFWKVIVKDGYNVVESPVSSFETLENLPPRVIPVYPPNGAFGIPVDVRLDWKGEDPEGGGILYDVYFGDSRENLKLVGKHRAETSYRLSGLDHEKTYYWKIVARDEYGNEVEGPTWKFRTALNLSPHVEYISPSNGATDLDTNVELKWKGGDPEGERILYKVELGSKGRMKIVKTGYDFETFMASNLNYGTTYQWRVSAEDESGNDMVGPVWSFKIRDNSPPTVAYISPEDRAEVDVNVRIVWSTHDPEGERTVSSLYIGEEELVKVYEGLETEFSTTLDYGKSYSWKIVVRDEHGNEIEGPIWSFKTARFSGWSRCFGGSGLDWAYSSLHDADGYTVVGYTYSKDGDLESNKGRSDVWIFHLSDEGDLIWSENFGGSSWEEGRDLVKSENGYTVVGYTSSKDGDVSKNSGSKDFWILEIDENGEIVREMSLGGSDSEEAHGICSDQNGYVIVGRTRSSDGDVGENLGGYDGWVVKLDEEWNVVWKRVIGSHLWDEVFDVLCDSRGDYVLVGYTTSPSSGQDVWVLKMDSVGNTIWEKSFGGSGNEKGFSVAEYEGGYVIAGYTGSNDGDVTDLHGGRDFWVIRLNRDGELIWQKTLGGSKDEEARKVVIDGRYTVVAGFSTSNDGDVEENEGESDFWVVKLDSNGNILWERTLGGSKMDEAFDLLSHPTGAFTLVGISRSSDGDVPSNHGNADAWLIQLENR